MDATKQAIGRYWGDQATTFDAQGDHSIGSEAERRAWARVLDLLAPSGRTLDVLDAGCGTGFLALLLAERGHRVTGSDLAPEMVEQARAKAAARGLSADFHTGDAEALDFDGGAFDLVLSRHLLWTLPHPDLAVREWARVVRPGGRVAVIDGEWRVAKTDEARAVEREATRTVYDSAVTAALPCVGGAPIGQVTALLQAAGLAQIRGDLLDDIVAAQRNRAISEGREPRAYVRYLVFGDRPASR